MKMMAEWFWTDRWMGSSAFLLPMEARGVYREMLSQAWRRGARLPADYAQVRRAIGASDEEWARSWPMVEKYWRVDGDSLVNDTQLEVYAEAEGKRERAQARAQAGAQARHKAQPKKVLKDEPPSPSPSPTAISTEQPPSSSSVDSRSDVDDARTEVRAALADWRKRHPKRHDIGIDDDGLLATVAEFFAPTGPVRLSTTNAKLLLATAGKIRADGRPKPTKARKVTAPGWDLGEAHAVPDEDITAWDPRLGPDPRLAASPEPPAPKRPDLTLTDAPGACPVCDSPIRHSSEAGETILRCAGEFAPCDWAAVWAEVRVA